MKKSKYLKKIIKNMNNYKKQHFVPKFYLQYFSPNYDRERKDGNIWIYDIKSKKIVINTVQKTAQKENFYDFDGEFEKLILNPIDDETAKVIKKIVTNKNITDFAKTTHETILKFLILQLDRTIASKKTVKIYNRYSSMKYPELRKIKDSIEVQALKFQYYIKMILASTCTISDLKPYLAINTTSIPFVTSDHPVVLNNYFLSNMDVHGFQTPGLQIICPISEKICFFLIHEEMYEITSDGPSKITVDQTIDIDLINSLQILNAHKHIFSSKNDNQVDIRKSNKIAVQIKRCFKKLERKRFSDDEKDRIYTIDFSFLKARNDIDMTQFVKNSVNPRLPNRNKSLYELAITRTEYVLKEFEDKHRELLEYEESLKSQRRAH